MFCPSCGAEYRPGFTQCAHCMIDLVEELPQRATMDMSELGDSVPVGLSSSSEVGRPIEIDGRIVDLMRLFTLDQATEVRDVLANHGIGQLLIPVEDLGFPDQRPRFEVRVRRSDGERAEDLLREVWRSMVEAEGTSPDAGLGNPEQCPACSAHIPLDAEECPECGLFVGASE